MEEKEVVKMNLDRNVFINDEALLTDVIKTTMLGSKIGRALNKLDNYQEMSQEKRVKLYKNAIRTGYFHLNGFADLYRQMIKISYVTLYRRIWHNKDILKTLIELEYIQNPYQNFNDVPLDLIIKDEDVKKSYWKIKVNYNKRRDFVKFIKENFLTEAQQNG